MISWEDLPNPGENSIWGALRFLFTATIVFFGRKGMWGLVSSCFHCKFPLSPAYDTRNWAKIQFWAWESSWTGRCAQSEICRPTEFWARRNTKMTREINEESDWLKLFFFSYELTFTVSFQEILHDIMKIGKAIVFDLNLYHTTYFSSTSLIW